MKKLAIGIIAGTIATLCLAATIDVWLLSEVTSPDADTDVVPIVKTGGSAGAGRKITVRHLAEWALAITHPRVRFVDESNGTGGVYLTFAAAATAAQPGDRIEILSELTASGAGTISVANVTVSWNGRKITSATQDDTQKIVVSGDNCTFEGYLEGNGTWDHSHSGTTTGGFITVNNKGFKNNGFIYIHDHQDNGITINGDFSHDRVQHIRADWINQSAIYANSQNAFITEADFGFIDITNVVLGKGLAVSRGGAETNPVQCVKIHDISYSSVNRLGSNEAVYAHGLTDPIIDRINGGKNNYGVSLDNCIRPNISNLNLNGGDQTVYSALELASCIKANVVNGFLNGTSIGESVTISIASPAVITLANHGFTAGQMVTFTTSGALPTGITANTTYFVIAAGLSSGTFEIAATSGGSAINTSGTQSGVHIGYAQSPAINTFSLTTAGIHLSNAVSDSNVRFRFDNIQSYGWGSGLNQQGAYHYIDVIGGYYSGIESGLQFDNADHVHLLGVTAEVTGSGASATPISLRAESGTQTDWQVSDCWLNAPSTAESDISLYATVSGAVVDQPRIERNTKLDSNSHSGGTLKTLTGSGGIITNLRVKDNVPSGQWVNDFPGRKLVFTPGSTGFYRVMSSALGAQQGTMHISTSHEDYDVHFSIPCCGDTDYVTESTGMIAHGLSQIVSQVRVGNNSSSTCTIDLNVAVASQPITVTFSEGSSFSAVPYVVDPPTSGASAPAVNAVLSLTAM